MEWQARSHLEKKNGLFPEQNFISSVLSNLITSWGNRECGAMVIEVGCNLVVLDGNMIVCIIGLVHVGRPTLPCDWGLEGFKNKMDNAENYPQKHCYYKI